MNRQMLNAIKARLAEFMSPDELARRLQAGETLTQRQLDTQATFSYFAYDTLQLLIQDAERQLETGSSDDTH